MDPLHCTILITSVYPLKSLEQKLKSKITDLHLCGVLVPLLEQAAVARVKHNKAGVLQVQLLAAHTVKSLYFDTLFSENRVFL
jgi:hypothetical protein